MPNDLIIWISATILSIMATVLIALIFRTPSKRKKPPILSVMPLLIDEPIKPGDLGHDLKTNEEVILKPGNIIAIPTARVKLPAGVGGLIVGRSGLNSKGVLSFTGLLDNGYTGQITVFLINLGVETITIPPMGRIAQLVLIPLDARPIKRVDSLPDTYRGSSGFGSTGW